MMRMKFLLSLGACEFEINCYVSLTSIIIMTFKFSIFGHLEPIQVSFSVLYMTLSSKPGINHFLRALISCRRKMEF